MKEYDNIEYLKWFVPTELNNSSYVYTSIIEFSNQTKIRWKISNKNINYRGKIIVTNSEIIKTKDLYNKITYIEVGFKNKKKLIAFDLNDSPNYFSNYALNKADIIFKRSYIKNKIEKLPFSFQEKIKPMGLPFMVRPNKMKYEFKFFCLFFLFKTNEIFKIDRLIFKRLNKIIFGIHKEWKNFINTRKLSSFNDFKKIYLSSNIFYQKRLFPYISDNDTEELHKQRVNIIRILKANFSNYFIGGLQNNKMAQNYYPSLISNIDGSEMSFLETLKTCGICVYTRGLALSNGWTISEFLSQGKCIIAEKTQIEIPIEIINNKELIFYENENNLIEIGKQLINKEDKREQMGNEARKYYENHVSPSVFLFNIFKHL